MKYGRQLKYYFLRFIRLRGEPHELALGLALGIFPSMMTSVQNGEEIMIVLGKIIGAGGTIIFAFLLGGFLMGVVVSIPSYFFSLRLFQFVRTWREKRRIRRSWRKEDL